MLSKNFNASQNNTMQFNSTTHQPCAEFLMRAQIKKNCHFAIWPLFSYHHRLVTNTFLSLFPWLTVILVFNFFYLDRNNYNTTRVDNKHLHTGRKIPYSVSLCLLILGLKAFITTFCIYQYLCTHSTVLFSWPLRACTVLKKLNVVCSYRHTDKKTFILAHFC